MDQVNVMLHKQTFTSGSSESLSAHFNVTCCFARVFDKPHLPNSDISGLLNLLTLILDEGDV